MNISDPTKSKKTHGKTVLQRMSPGKLPGKAGLIFAGRRTCAIQEVDHG
jgi:hypothetical protein